MKISKCVLTRIVKWTTFLMLGVSMSACSSSANWKEEVQLSDGRIIVVEREALRQRGGDEWASNRSGTKPTEYRIRISNPDDSEMIVEWRSTKMSPGTWPEKPLVLDVESGIFVVFSSVFDAGGCHLYSKYLFRNGAWTEDALPQQFEHRETNLLIFDDDDMQQPVNLQTKRKKNSDSRAQHFRRVGPKHPYCY